jgi:acyl-CoA thioesterase-2
LTIRDGSVLMRRNRRLLCAQAGFTVNPPAARACSTMSQISDSLMSILDLEPLERNLFRGRSPRVGWPRVFGGQVIAQSLYAACKTVEGRQPHSLHAYFLLGGDPEIPIIYEVDRLRDGRSFTTRRVLAIQKGEAIFAMSASFQVEEPGYEHQMPMPDVPPPEELPDRDAHGAAMSSRICPRRCAPITSASGRSTSARSSCAAMPAPARPREPKLPCLGQGRCSRCPTTRRSTRAVLAYASDLMLLDSSLIAHGTTVFDPQVQAASLDHALWFHRPFRADDWLLYAQDSPSASGARGFSRGLVFDRQGRSSPRSRRRAWSGRDPTAPDAVLGNSSQIHHPLDFWAGCPRRNHSGAAIPAACRVSMPPRRQLARALNCVRRRAAMTGARGATGSPGLTSGRRNGETQQ